MSRKRRNTIPDIPKDAGPLRHWMNAVKESLEVGLGRRGDPGEAYVSFNDLIDMKILTGVSRINPSFLPEFEGGGIPDVPGGGVLPSTPPPKPSGFTAAGTFNGVFLDWDLVPSRPDITLTEVRRSDQNDFETALPIGSINGSNYFDIILGNQQQTFFYWIRHVSANGLTGAWSDVAEATTEPDVEYLLQTLSDSISESQLAQTLESRIDLIDGDEQLNGSVNARIAEEATLREDGDDALSQQITTVQTNLNNDIASVEQVLSARIENLTNLVPNGSFITGDFTDWNLPGSVSVVLEERDPSSGTNAIRESPTRFMAHFLDEAHGSTRTMSVPGFVQVAEGDTYSLRFHYAGGGTGISGNVRMLVRWFDENGAFVANSTFLVETFNSVQWNVSDTITVQVPTGANQAQVWIQRLSGSSGHLFVTNIVAQRADAVLETMFTVKLDVNGYVAGYGLFNDGSFSRAIWHVDQFAIGSPTDTSGGVVEVVFDDQFSDSSTLGNWTNVNGSGEAAIVTDGATTFLRAGNNSGDDQVWFIHDVNIPFDPNVLYKISARVRRTAGSGRLYVGWAGVASDGTTLVNIHGDDNAGSQHYHAASAENPPSGYHLYEGYTKGHGSNNGGIGTKSSPKNMHPDVAFIRPLILMNYQNETGITECDFWTARNVTDVDTNDVYPFILDDGIVYIDQARIKDGSIQTAKIGDAVITSAKIANASIVNAKISNGAITTAKIQNGDITRAKIQNAAISRAKIANAAVDTAQIASAAITTAKIQNAAVQTLKIAGQAVTIPSSSFISGQRSVSQNYVNLVSLSYTSSGAPTYVHASCIVDQQGIFDGASPGASLSRCRINRSGGIIYEKGFNTAIAISFGIRDTSSATGGRIYRFQMRTVRGTQLRNHLVSGRCIFTLETKR